MVDENSREAFDSIRNEREAMYLKILRLLTSYDATCDEIEMGLSMIHQTASARVCELHKNGRIKRTGQKRPTRSGRAAHVYKITRSGQAWLDIN